mgnify:FL=1
MAQQVHAAFISPAGAAAHNSIHASLSSGFAHYDGPEYDADTLLPALLGSGNPATLAEAAAIILAGKDYINGHFALADVTVGDHIYAHKVPDAAHTITAVMAPWAPIEAALSEAARLLVNDATAKYEAHRLNTGGVWHAAVDTVNNVGTPNSFSALEWTDLKGVERTNLLKALWNDHVVLTSGGVHWGPDTGNQISAVNATYDAVDGADWIKWLALLTELRTKFIAHPPTASHALVDNTNIVSAPLPSVPAGTFDLVNDELTQWNLHVPSTTYHPMADAGSQTSITSVATLADMLAAAQQIYAKALSHVTAAPLSRPVRIVV